MILTEYHAADYARELSRRHSLGNSEKIALALADSNVDLNPHQLDAALFAFRSLLSKGVILADEVGLGKTIEKNTTRLCLRRCRGGWAHERDRFGFI